MRLTIIWVAGQISPTLEYRILSGLSCRVRSGRLEIQLQVDRESGRQVRLYSARQQQGWRAGQLYHHTRKRVNPGGPVNGSYVTGSGTYILPAIAASAFLFRQFLSYLSREQHALDYTNANPNSLISVQHYNFAPRIGLAYSIDAKTVVRAGYGMFYGAIESPGGAELETNYPFAYTAVMYNPYLGNYGECFPSTNAGYNNYQSQCPSNGTSDLAESNPANPSYPNAYRIRLLYSIPAGWNPFPFPTTLETGASAYFVGGVVNPANGSVGNCARHGRSQRQDSLHAKLQLDD